MGPRLKMIVKIGHSQGRERTLETTLRPWLRWVCLEGIHPFSVVFKGCQTDTQAYHLMSTTEPMTENRLSAPVHASATPCQHDVMMSREQALLLAATHTLTKTKKKTTLSQTPLCAWPPHRCPPLPMRRAMPALWVLE